MAHIHNEYYSAVKKDKGKQLVHTWISVLSIILSEVHQRDKHKEWSFIHSVSRHRWGKTNNH